MSVEDKIDQLLVDVAVVKTISSQHTSELLELQEKLDPIFEHVTMVKTVVKIGSAAIGFIACIAGIAALFK